MPKLFSELIEIIHANDIVVKNAEVSDMILQFDDDARNPPLSICLRSPTLLASISRIYSSITEISGILSTPPACLPNRGLLTAKRSIGISERIHLHLSGLIEETSRKKNVSLEELALQTRINLKIFHQITVERDIPLLFSLLQILVRLDVDVVDFFRRVETSLEKRAPPPYFGKTIEVSSKYKQMGDIEKYTANVYGEVIRGTKEIF